MKKSSILKDVMLIIACIVAIGLLTYILVSNKENKVEKNDYIENLSAEIKENNVKNTDDRSIIINEINHQGWIELYNPSANVSSLNGMQIYYQGESVYTFGEQIINAEEYIVIELGSKIAEEENEIIALYDSEGNALMHILLPKLLVNQSYGYVKNGGKELSVMTATRGESNETAQLSEADRNLSFSVVSGFYNEPFELVLTSAAGYKIYYTTDGTEPTTKSTLFETPITISNRSGSNFTYASMVDSNYFPDTINMGTVVRAIAVDSKNNIVEERSQSYFVNLSYTGDYDGMPIISITMNPEDLFDYEEGIYVKGRSYDDNIISGGIETTAANYLNKWERSAYIEYFEEDKYLSFAENLNISIYLDYNVKNGQKGWLIKGDTKAGKGSSLNTYFNESSKALALMTNGRDNTYKSRQYIARELVKYTSTDMADVEPCIVFINGEYWGCYMLVQEWNKQYFEETYGVESAIRTNTSWQTNYVTSSNEFEELVYFVITHDMADEAEYKYVSEQMDIQNYLDYVCFNMYLANADYDYSYNAVVWKSDDLVNSEYGDSRWRWLVEDLSYSMGNVIKHEITKSQSNTFKLKTVSNDAFFQSLLMNDLFCKQLNETMEKMVKEVFTTDHVELAIEKTQNMMKEQAENTYYRFVSKHADNFYQSGIDIISSFFEYRNDFILKYTYEVTEQKGNEDIIALARQNIAAGLEIDGSEINENSVEIITQ